jgi:NTP pyrophosphatase (non-canonical NTP hydrolase)
MNYDGSFTAYQQLATETAVYPGQGSLQGLTYAVLGLAGEAGETAEQVKKTWRDDGTVDMKQAVKDLLFRLEDDLHTLAQLGADSHNVFLKVRAEADEIFHAPLTAERREKIIKELGDVLWYAAQLCTELDIAMSEVAGQNLRKLAERKSANKLHGEGSAR